MSSTQHLILDALLLFFFLSFDFKNSKSVNNFALINIKLIQDFKYQFFTNILMSITLLKPKLARVILLENGARIVHSLTQPLWQWQARTCVATQKSSPHGAECLIHLSELSASQALQDTERIRENQIWS